MIEGIPDRIYYRIKEVSTLTGLKPHILRYWEREFREIRPIKSSKGQRLYRKKDLDVIIVIKRLLYERKFTIDGARLYLSTQKSLVDELRQELDELVALLNKGECQ
jgi:DNA-binding transcriptional MerR regulator